MSYLVGRLSYRTTSYRRICCVLSPNDLGMISRHLCHVREFIYGSRGSFNLRASRLTRYTTTIDSDWELSSGIERGEDHGRFRCGPATEPPFVRAATSPRECASMYRRVTLIRRASWRDARVADQRANRNREARHRDLILSLPSSSPSRAERGRSSFARPRFLARWLSQMRMTRPRNPRAIWISRSAVLCTTRRC